MALRALLFFGMLTGSALAGCNNPVDTGSPCFDSGECRSGVCTVTVYGRFCMNTCTEGTVTCERDEACVQGEGNVGAGGAGGGAGGATGLFVCLPGDLDAEGFEPVEILGVCTYSLDCVRGGVCVCLQGQECDPENDDRTGPICVEVCDPTMVNRCPLQQACVDLGNGSGFCDPTTSQPI